MNTRKTPIDGGGGRTAKAVILYDHLETMLLANQLVGRLPRATGAATDWTVKSWHFAMLGQGLEGDRALQETDDAEVMVLAIGREEHLQDWPQHWLVRWLARRKSLPVTILVMLIGLADTVASEWSVVAPLRWLADAGRYGLFVFDDTRTGAGPPGSSKLHDV